MTKSSPNGRTIQVSELLSFIYIYRLNDFFGGLLLNLSITIDYIIDYITIMCPEIDLYIYIIIICPEIDFYRYITIMCPEEWIQKKTSEVF